MKPKIVIYCSNHGSSRLIAEQIGKNCGLPVIDIKNITGYSFREVPIIFCGWVRNGIIQGLDKAYDLFTCMKIVAIGCIRDSEEYYYKLKQLNKISNSSFEYVCSCTRVNLTMIERVWLFFFQPSLFGILKKKGVGDIV